MYTNHVSSITRIIFELFSTNMTGESFDITMSKHMFFQTIGGEKTLATKFTDMFSTALVFIVFTPEIVKRKA